MYVYIYIYIHMDSMYGSEMVVEKHGKARTIPAHFQVAEFHYRLH